MYTVSVKREFTAYHYLIGGNWGPENERHAHHYNIEVELQGQNLDRHGYLLDIVEIERIFDTILERYAGKTLNDLPEFKDMNPSIENFSRIMCHGFIRHIRIKNIKAITVKIWENEIACASYRQEL